MLCASELLVHFQKPARFPIVLSPSLPDVAFRMAGAAPGGFGDGAWTKRVTFSGTVFIFWPRGVPPFEGEEGLVNA